MQNKIMITEDYVSFETAKLLKKRGLDDEYANAFYDKTGNLYFIDLLSDLSSHPDNDTDIAASTLYVAMKWLREIFKLNIEVFTYWTKDKSAVYGNRVVRDNSIVKDVETAYNTYEEACEAAIKYCLENLI